MIIIEPVLLRILGGLNELHTGVPGDSEGKESACDVGDLGLIPGLGRFPGGGKEVALEL